jgi:hypothetical protein
MNSVVVDVVNNKQKKSYVAFYCRSSSEWEQMRHMTVAALNNLLLGL